MHTTDYISNDVKALHLTDDLADVKIVFSQLPHSHLPVLDEGIFCGALAKKDVEFLDPVGKTVNTFKHQLNLFYANEKMNWFEVLQYFATFKTNLMPILDKEKKYIGYYELEDFLNIFKCTPFLHEEGVILVISKDINDYSFSEITQIVESNNATLFGAFVSKIENNMAEITLKLSLHDINNTLHSFRRYNYEILNEFEKDDYLEELNERSNYLQKYLNI
jgi:predicted transcriptional regulator